MPAVHTYYVHGKGVQEIAQYLPQCTSWVAQWVERFEKEVLRATLESLQMRRPVKIPHKMDQIMLKASLGRGGFWCSDHHFVPEPKLNSYMI